jgi:hypothetical protein
MASEIYLGEYLESGREILKYKKQGNKLVSLSKG